LDNAFIDTQNKDFKIHTYGVYENHLHLSQKLSKQHLLVNTASIITFLHSRQWSSAGKSSTALTGAAGTNSSRMPLTGLTVTTGARDRLILLLWNLGSPMVMQW
jgi:hypothetical protein